MARKQPVKMIALEPASMSVPAMDRPSVAFAWFLDNMLIEDSSPSRATADIHYLVCALCSTRICEINDGDTLRVLLNTALAHGCQT